MALLEINRNDIILSMGPMNPTISAPAMNIWNLSYFVTGTYTNMKSGCQIGMDYLWGTIFQMATSEVKLRFRL